MIVYGKRLSEPQSPIQAPRIHSTVYKDSSVTTGCVCFRHSLSQGCGGALSGLNGACWIIWVVSMVILNCQLLCFFSSGEQELLFTDFWWLNDNTECWRWLSHCALHHSSHFVKEPAIIWTLTLFWTYVWLVTFRENRVYIWSGHDRCRHCLPWTSRGAWRGQTEPADTWEPGGRRRWGGYRHRWWCSWWR